MKYCSRCLLPATRPGIGIDAEGVCAACRGHEDKEFRINWTQRAREFDKIVAEAKRRSTGYDCIVPASGGKDSWYQAIVAKQHGLRVLAVTWRTPARTAVGQQNLENMVRSLGIDHIDHTIDPDVERRFTKASYERKGATGIPMHMAIFTIPIKIAVGLRVPLIIWGENPQLEFGGPEKDRLAMDLDLQWVRKYGVTSATEWKDWVGHEGLTEADFAPYRMPDERDFAAFGPRSIFLGSFFKWNSFQNAAIARKYGFKYAESHLKTGLWDFADIDCDLISLHHFLKWYKFGVTRAFDNLSVQIRYGMITREVAIDTLRGIGIQVPTADIRKFCAWVDKPESWFWDIAESFRNREIWYQDRGVWKIRDFLIPDWPWEASMRAEQAQ